MPLWRLQLSPAAARAGEKTIPIVEFVSQFCFGRPVHGRQAAALARRWLLVALRFQLLFALRFASCHGFLSAGSTLRLGHVAGRFAAALRAKLAQVCFELLLSWGHVTYILPVWASPIQHL